MTAMVVVLAAKTTAVVVIIVNWIDESDCTDSESEEGRNAMVQCL